MTAGDHEVVLPPLAKQLASNEKAIRDKAVLDLEVYLSGKKSSSGKYKAKSTNGDIGGKEEIELEEGDKSAWDDKDWKPDDRMKEEVLSVLWHGLFYCVWMSDKPLVQQALTTQLANLILKINPAKQRPQTKTERALCALTFSRAFYEAIIREWSGIDRYRMDKYYLLLRQVMTASFLFLEREDWDPRIADMYSSILVDYPLLVNSASTPIGVTLHVCTVFFDELFKAISQENETIREEQDSSSSVSKIPLIQVLHPFFHALTRCPNKNTYTRIYEASFQRLFQFLEPQSTQSRPSKRRKSEKKAAVQEPVVDLERICLATTNTSSESPQSVDEILIAIRKAFFDYGAKEDTIESNRRKMYAVWRAGEEVES